jgi:hypothetical protein
MKLVAILVVALTASLLETGAAHAADPVADEATFLAKLNAVRASHGVRPLSSSGALVNMARAWSAKMAADGGISHNPALSAQAPSNWARLGENVGYGPNVQSIHDALVASPGHFRNMVDGAFSEVGIGVVYSASRIYVTVDFMTPQNAPVSAAAAPANPAPAKATSTPATTTKTRCRKVGKRTVCRKVAVRKAAPKAKRAVRRR